MHASVGGGRQFNLYFRSLLMWNINPLTWKSINLLGSLSFTISFGLPDHFTMPLHLYWSCTEWGLTVEFCDKQHVCCCLEVPNWKLNQPLSIKQFLWALDQYFCLYMDLWLGGFSRSVLVNVSTNWKTLVFQGIFEEFFSQCFNELESPSAISL